MRYLDFDLAIDRTTDGYCARIVNSPAGIAVHAFSNPFTEQDLEILQLKVGRHRRETRRIASPEMGAIKKFGESLFNAVFGGAVRECLRCSLDEAERHQSGLRLRLRLSSVPELADWPWEYLHNPTLQRFFSLSEWTPIVRYIDLPEIIRPLRIHPPVHIISVISNPDDAPPIDANDEWGRLRSALEEPVRNGRVTLELLEKASLQCLQRRLRRGDVHILHFIGHGGYDRQEDDGFLVFESENGRSMRISGQYLGTILHDHRPLRLVVLNTCEGARGGIADPFAGAAQSLIQQGIPSVIAMQFEITDAAAICFSHEFYTAIADGLPIDAAVAEARKSIFGQGNDVEWGTPVLYLRAADGQIFDLQSSSTPVKTDQAWKQGINVERRRPVAEQNRDATENTHIEQARQEQTVEAERQRVVALEAEKAHQEEMWQREQAAKIERQRQSEEALEKAKEAEQARIEKQRQDQADEAKRQKAAALEAEKAHQEELRQRAQAAEIERQRQSDEALQKAKEAEQARIEKQRQDQADEAKRQKAAALEAEKAHQEELRQREQAAEIKRQRQSDEALQKAKEAEQARIEKQRQDQADEAKRLKAAALEAEKAHQEELRQREQAAEIERQRQSEEAQRKAKEAEQARIEKQRQDQADAAKRQKAADLEAEKARQDEQQQQKQNSAPEHIHSAKVVNAGNNLQGKVQNDKRSKEAGTSSKVVQVVGVLFVIATGIFISSKSSDPKKEELTVLPPSMEAVPAPAPAPSPSSDNPPPRQQITYSNTDLDELREQAQKGDASARDTLIELANEGNDSAQFRLGQLFYEPQSAPDIPRDHAKAVELWQKASDNGYGRASMALGNIYAAGGKSLEKDLNLAISYYERALNNGWATPIAKLRLARAMLNRGDGSDCRRIDTFLKEISDSSDDSIGPSTLAATKAEAAVVQHSAQKKDLCG